jgi:DNA processing protein
LKEDLKYIMGLQKTPKVGVRLAKTLIAYAGSPEAVFKEKLHYLDKIPGIGTGIAKEIKNFKDFDFAEKEIEFAKKHDIRILTYLGDDYPHRMKDIEDAPLILYARGNMDMNVHRTLAVVGTRKATSYGKYMCEKIISELAVYGFTLISGLAYGIDYHAHKQALRENIQNIAVLGHGLDMIYPVNHRATAIKMLENGGLLTEYPSQTALKSSNFPERNRIVAGMSDAVLVVESGLKGGALITAQIAYSYNRDIFALPGRVIDEYSIGCNNYIKINKACLVDSAADIAFQMGWDSEKQKNENVRIPEFESEEERKIYGLIAEYDGMDIDTLAIRTAFKSSELNLYLLNMEFRGLIKAYPGNCFKTI